MSNVHNNANNEAVLSCRDLAKTFTTASRLEAGFWEMGLKLLP